MGLSGTWSGALYYALGFVVAILAHFPINFFVKSMWIRLIRGLKFEKEHPNYWMSTITGVIERIIFLSAFILHQPIVIGFWLAIKVAARWSRWDDEFQNIQTDELRKSLSGRARYMILVNATGLSIIFSGVAWFLIEILINKTYQLKTHNDTLLIWCILLFIVTSSCYIVGKLLRWSTIKKR